jgi:hypothetical protein
MRLANKQQKFGTLGEKINTLQQYCLFTNTSESFKTSTVQNNQFLLEVLVVLLLSLMDLAEWCQERVFEFIT